eukprot:3494903-Pyramimonas_sp.AAC.1
MLRREHLPVIAIYLVHHLFPRSRLSPDEHTPRRTYASTNIRPGKHTHAASQFGVDSSRSPLERSGTERSGGRGLDSLFWVAPCAAA